MPTPTSAEIQQLENRALTVRDETGIRANTAFRVGSLFLDIVRKLGSSVEVINNLTEFTEEYLTVLQELHAYYTQNGNTIANTFQGTIIRLEEREPPSPIPASHKLGDLWINGVNGNIYELTSAGLYGRKGNLKGPSGYSVLVAYADNANGDNPSPSAIGKKFRAEYVPTSADPNPTVFNPQKVVGAWIPYGNQRVNGVHNGTIVNMAVDNQTATDFAGVWNITEFINVYAGAQARIKRRSLNNIWVVGQNMVRVGYDSNGYETQVLSRVDVFGGVISPFQNFLPLGSLIRLGGQERRVVGLGYDYFMVDVPFSTRFSNVTWEYVVKDSLQLPAGSQALINGVSRAGNFQLNQFGTFIEGAINVLRLECVAVTGTVTEPIYEFDLFISNS